MVGIEGAVVICAGRVLVCAGECQWRFCEALEHCPQCALLDKLVMGQKAGHFRAVTPVADVRHALVAQ